MLARDRVQGLSGRRLPRTVELHAAAATNGRGNQRLQMPSNVILKQYVLYAPEFPDSSFEYRAAQ